VLQRTGYTFFGDGAGNVRVAFEVRGFVKLIVIGWGNEPAHVFIPPPQFALCW
jgi:hypothetical protein